MNRERALQLRKWSLVAREAFRCKVALFSYGDGWKAVTSYVYHDEEHRGYLSTIQPCPTPEGACRDLILRERVLSANDANWVDIQMWLETPTVPDAPGENL